MGKLEPGSAPLAEELVSLITLSYCLVSVERVANGLSMTDEVSAKELHMVGVLILRAALRDMTFFPRAVTLGHCRPDTLGSVHSLLCIPTADDWADSSLTTVPCWLQASLVVTSSVMPSLAPLPSLHATKPAPLSHSTHHLALPLCPCAFPPPA